MTVLDKQALAVLREYREALEDRDHELANRILYANPDLHKALAQEEAEYFDALNAEETFEEGPAACECPLSSCDYCDGTGLVDSDGNPAPYASGDLLSCPRCKGEGA